MLDVLAMIEVSWLAFVSSAMILCFAFLVGRRFSVQLPDQRIAGSQPNENGAYLAMWVVAPTLLLFALYFMFGEPLVRFLLESDLPTGFERLTNVERQQYVDRAGQALGLETIPSGADPIFHAVVDHYRALPSL